METILYDEKFGPVIWPDGFEQELEGKTIEEQLDCYVIVSSHLNLMSYHMADKEYFRYGCNRLSSQKFDQVILKNGLVVGVTRYGKPYLPNELWSFDYCSDNNGSGYKERYYYSYLVCIPRNLEREVIKVPPFGVSVNEFSVPITEYDKDVSFSEEFLEQIKGKSIHEQADYFRITTDENKEINLLDEDYNYNWMCGKYGTLLRYEKRLTEVMVKNGVIVGIKFVEINKKYNLKKEFILFVNEKQSFNILLEKDDDGYRWWCPTFCLESIIYK